MTSYTQEIIDEFSDAEVKAAVKELDFDTECPNTRRGRAMSLALRNYSFTQIRNAIKRHNNKHRSSVSVRGSRATARPPVFKATKSTRTLFGNIPGVAGETRIKETETGGYHARQKIPFKGGWHSVETHIFGSRMSKENFEEGVTGFLKNAFMLGGERGVTNGTSGGPRRDVDYDIGHAHAHDCCRGRSRSGDVVIDVDVEVDMFGFGRGTGREVSRPTSRPSPVSREVIRRDASLDATRMFQQLFGGRF